MAKEQPTAKEKDGGASLRINLATHGFPRRMYFNRYHIENFEENVVLHFGLVDGSAVVRDYFSCVVSKLSLEDNAARLKSFIAKSGVTPKNVSPSVWIPPIGQFSNRNVEFVTFMNAAYHAGEGELTLYAFSLHAAILKSQGKLPGESFPENDDTLKTDPVIMLRSSWELQKQLFFQLFVK